MSTPYPQNRPSEDNPDWQRELRVHHLYEWIHITNDAVISLWFLVGSIFFFYPSMQDTGTWLFVIGSCQMLLGPVIRTFNKLHVKHVIKQNLHF